MNHPLTLPQHPFEEQDSKERVLLLCILLFPLAALLPHTHVTTALFVFLCLLLCGRKRNAFSVFQNANVKIYCLFICISLSAVVILAVWKETLLSTLLRLSFLLPFVWRRGRGALFVFSLSGFLLGLFSACELLLGRGIEGYADTTLFPHLSRAVGPFGNPNILAAYLLPAALLSLAEALFSSRNRHLYLLFFLGNTVGILATFSRGAMLALLFAALPLFLRRFGFLRLFAVFCAFFPLGSLLLPAAITARLASLGTKDSSVFYRFSLWKSIFRVPRHLLLLGVGEGKDAMLTLLFPYLAAGLSHVEHTHSIYLHLLISSGILGLSLFIALVLRALLGRGHIGARAALLSLLIFGIFDDPLYSGQTEVLFWILLGCSACVGRDSFCYSLPFLCPPFSFFSPSAAKKR